MSDEQRFAVGARVRLSAVGQRLVRTGLIESPTRRDGLLAGVGIVTAVRTTSDKAWLVQWPDAEDYISWYYESELEPVAAVDAGDM